MEEPLYSNNGKGKVKVQHRKAFAVQLKEEEKIFLRRLAHRIRELRSLNGISQEKFYQDTNIHIGRIETGRLNISVNTLFRICVYLEISVKDFFDGLKKK